MDTTTPNLTCPACQVTARKHGKDAKGHQRYQCPKCLKTVSDVPAGPLGHMRLPLDKAVLCLQLIAEGNSLRSTSTRWLWPRRTGRSRSTLAELEGEVMEVGTPDIQCENCGFLAWRVSGDDASPFYEVSVERRESGVCPSEGSMRGVSNTPYCYRRMTLPAFIYQAGIQGGSSTKDSFHEAIGTHHECEYFTLHRPGLSPKEHDDMIVSAEAERVKASAAVDKQNRDIEQADKVRREQWARDDELRVKREAREDRNRRGDTRLKVAIFLGGIVLAALGYGLRWLIEWLK